MCVSFQDLRFEGRVLICTCDSCLGNKLQDKLQNKLQDELQSTLLNKLQNTAYVDNDVDVDYADDEEEGTGAYFFGQTQQCVHHQSFYC